MSVYMKTNKQLKRSGIYCEKCCVLEKEGTRKDKKIQGKGALELPSSTHYS